MIDYRQLTTVEAFLQVVELERIIWGMGDVDVTPPHLMKINTHNGGATFGAFDNDKMVGFAIALPRQEEATLWSHVTGVIRAYRGRGIGQRLKFVQRDWAYAQGYRIINWTFDPMRRQNAHFNINLLGTTSHTLHENIYGNMKDELNTGMSSDRLEAHWEITKPLSEKRPEYNYSDFPFLLHTKSHHKIITVVDHQWNEVGYRVEIPYCLDALKHADLQAAINWQAALRNTLQIAYSHQYHTSGFENADNRCWYILTRRKT